MGEHETFEEDTPDFMFLTARIAALSTDILRRCLSSSVKKFKTVVLTVRFEDFETRTRSITVKNPLSSARELEQKGLKLILPFFTKRKNPQKQRIRMLGLRIEKLS